METEKTTAKRSAFPNDLGNYAGKRVPKARAAALTPKESFQWLAATFLAMQRPKRVQLSSEEQHRNYLNNQAKKMENA